MGNLEVDPTQCSLSPSGSCVHGAAGPSSSLPGEGSAVGNSKVKSAE